MKKFYLVLVVFVPFISFAQNVGIGTTTPLTKLTVQTTTGNYGISHTDGTITLGTYVGGGYGWFGTKSNHALTFFTNNSQPQMTLYTNGNLGIGLGITSPVNKLQIGSMGTTGFNGNDLAIGNGINAIGFAQTNTVTQIASSTNIAFLPNANNGKGNVGINVSNPTNRLQIGSLGVGGFGNYDLAIGNGTNEFGIAQTNAITQFASSTDMIFLPNGNNGQGNVGINVSRPNNKLQIGSVGDSYFSSFDLAIGNGTNAFGIYQTNNFTQFRATTKMIFLPNQEFVGFHVGNPTNKLQIGSVGTSGFSGNDFALGNGQNALGIYQTNAASQFASSTDITFMPRTNGAGVGKVGINTLRPRVPLEVVNNIRLDEYGFYSYLNLYSQLNGIGGANEDNIPDVSILSSGRMLATEFDAYSDVRIKNITGISDNSKDLQTLNALHITDYTLKDKVQHGNKTYKKIIAQQVEKVYPQVVSKHTDFIPNVYQVSDKVERTSNGLRVVFTNKHNISKTAKKLRVILAKDGTQVMDIVSIPSETEVVVSGKEIKSDKLFVYGEEVNDFRTVDYEGLTTLNISATQELSKLIDALNEKIVLLEKRVEQLETKK